MAQMDEIDQKQQEEISALQRKDIEHDSLIERIYIFFFLTVLAIFIAGFMTYPFFTHKQAPIALNCPCKTHVP